MGYITADNLPGLIWIVIVIGVLLWIRKDFKVLVAAIVERVRAGAGFKIGGIELESLNISHARKDDTQKADAPTIQVTYRDKTEDDEKFSLDALYHETRNCFLVHKLFPSPKSNYLYDAYIYVSAKSKKLEAISRVEYFLGEGFGNRVFISESRQKRFGVVVSVNGSHMIACARIHFKQESGFDSIFTWRFVDFENGPIGQSSRDK